MDRVVLIISGTRPEVIKLFPIYHELKKTAIPVFWVAVLQHKSLQLQILKSLEIAPDFFIKLSRRKTLSDLYSTLVQQLDLFLQKKSILAVIVQGDTATTFCASLAAFLNKIKIIYIEAGLRSFDLQAPYPEEANRQMVARLADLLFAPTIYDKKNLIKEGISSKKIFVTGNSIVSAVDTCFKKMKMTPSVVSKKLQKIIEMLLKKNKKIIYFSMHRREAFPDFVQHVFFQIDQICADPKNVDYVFLWPVHPSLLVKNAAQELKKKLNDKLVLLNSLKYWDSLFLLNHSCFVMSDSGGLFEEAISLNKPIIALRIKSERMLPELRNFAFLLKDIFATDLTELFQACSSLSKELVSKKEVTAFGDRHSAKKIVKVVQTFLNLE